MPHDLKGDQEEDDPEEAHEGRQAMSRRGNGEGSIGQLKDGRWLARTSFDGRRKAYYGRTRIEVAQRLALAIKAHRDGLAAPSDKQTFGQFVERWVETVTPSLRPKTARN